MQNAWFSALIALFLFSTTTAHAQQVLGTTAPDTIHGIAVVTDSIIVMRSGTGPHDYQFGNALAAIVVDATMVIRPDNSQNFFYRPRGTRIDPARILIFKRSAPK